MIPGTNKKTAALAITRSIWVSGPTISARSLLALSFKKFERRELVRAGKLPGSCRYPHAAKLGVDMVRLSSEPIKDIGCYGLDYWLRFDVEQTLFVTISGLWELWFNDQGEAYISFEDDQDATMFALALEGDRS
jgi:hypothetical protein